MPTPTDPSAREAVWIALSDLYLDTDTESSIEPCAERLAESPFANDELKRILFEEVHPALVANLLSVAGAWAGFDPDWLCARIRRQQASAWQLRWFWRRVLTGVPRGLWPRLDAIITRLRSAESVR
jgi:hypothetical protein